MTDKEMIDEISENILYCTDKDREVYPWDSSQQQKAKRVIELARLGEKYEQLLADMKERKTGKWKKRLVATKPFTLYFYECPFCEFRTVINSFNFCPNCGVKMEVDKSE